MRQDYQKQGKKRKKKGKRETGQNRSDKMEDLSDTRKLKVFSIESRKGITKPSCVEQKGKAF